MDTCKLSTVHCQLDTVENITSGNLHLSESLLCLCWFYFSTSDWPLICFLQKFSATNKNFLFFQVIINIFFTNLLWLSDLGSNYETILSYNSPSPRPSSSPSPRHPPPSRTPGPLLFLCLLNTKDVAGPDHRIREICCCVVGPFCTIFCDPKLSDKFFGRYFQ